MQKNKKVALLSMLFVMPTFLLACNNSPLHDHWYEYTEEEKWWEHCSNGGIEAATEADIGKTVKITLNGLEHEVRLIDVDHLEPNKTTPQAHCTFEFVNVITKNDNSAYKVAWNKKDSTDSKNYDFPNYSNLNDALKSGGDVYKMFPTNEGSLISKMVNVTKYVGTSEDSGVSYAATTYTTKLFPLAYYEFYEFNVTEGNGDSTAIPSEGSIYKYYKNHPGNEYRIKRIVNDEDPQRCWLRSLSTTRQSPVGGRAFHIEDSTSASPGSIAITPIYFEFAVAPAFCI